MNKIRIIALSISLIIIANTTLHAKINYPENNSLSELFSVNDLSKKKYYEDIFNKAERKHLKKAEKYLLAAEKYMDQYDADQRKIEKLYTIAEATSSQKSREKSLKKARKLEIKALKKGMKAIRYYKKGTNIKKKIYSTAINRIRLNDNSKNAKLGRNIELEAKNIYETAEKKERTAPQHDDQLKFNVFREANSMTLRALSMQETAIGLYKNDESVKVDDINIPTIDDNNNITDSVKIIINPDSVLFPVYPEQYNPLTDPNLYRSKANIIYPRLNLSNQDMNMIREASRENQKANNLLKQVDNDYLIVDSLNYVADRTEDFYQRDKLRTRAVEKESSAFYKLIKATNKYLSVNETRYKVYEKHYPKIDPNKQNSDTQRAKKFQEEAKDYYAKAKSEIARAKNIMFKSEQYLKLMGANDLMLYALQLQESAYSIYFNMPEAMSSVVDTSFIDDNNINNSNVSASENTSGLSWSFLSRYTYSKEKPKPARYKNKKGVVFLVQVGIFKGLLPPAKFGTVQPLVFDKFVKNPYRRYMAGEYKTYEAAQLALSKVKALGYTDAYIVSLVDGNRNTAEYGQSKVKKDDHYAYLSRMEAARIKGETFSENKTSNSNQAYTTGGSVTNTKGLLYFVQLGMFSNPDAGNQFKNLQPIFTDKVKGIGTRYLLGTYGKIAVARAQSQRVKNMGYKDAYVTAYYNGQHIKLDKAKKLEKQQYGSVTNNTNNVTTTNNVAKGSISFMVQVGAYSQALSNADENKLKSKFAPRNVNRKFAKGMNVYIIGNYKTYKEADYLKRKLLDEGHQGVFVVAFEGTNKIPVGEAIKKSK